jgi:signal transduction histidine kinase
MNGPVFTERLIEAVAILIVIAVMLVAALCILVNKMRKGD